MDQTASESKSTLQQVRVCDVMTRHVITVLASESLAAADFEMRVAGVRHLPVVDERNRLVGILSTHDYYRLAARHPSARIEVTHCMSRDVHTVRPETRLAVAAQLMLDRKIGALPVTDVEGKLVGMVTDTDLLRAAYLPTSRGGDEPC